MDIDPAGLYYGIQLLLNFITFTCSVELHIMHDVYQFNIQLALEKCELELHGSTYKQNFLIVNATVLLGLWLADSTDMEEPWI